MESLNENLWSSLNENSIVQCDDDDDCWCETNGCWCNDLPDCKNECFCFKFSCCL